MKLFLSRFLACLMISLSLLNCISITSFASPVLDAGLEEASSSDADREFDIEDTETYFHSLSDNIQAYASGLPSVVNSIDYSNLKVRLSYYNNKDVVKYIWAYPDSNGYFSFSKPSDFSYFNQLMFYFTPSGSLSNSALPKPGNYDFSGRFSSNTGGFTWPSIRLWRAYSSENSATISKADDIPGFRQESGDWYFSTSLKVASNTQLFEVYFNMGGMKDISFPIGGYISFRFSPISTSGVLSSSPIPPPSSDDIQSDISNSVQDISNGVTIVNQTITNMSDSINKNLEEIIRTISMQLEAFWQQLYNGIYLPWVNNDNANTNKITSSIDTLDSDVVDALENLDSSGNSNANKIINNQNQNTQNIVNNNNANTDKLANGYDNTIIIDGNDKLTGILDSYEHLEEELLSDTKDNLNNFQFENPFLSFNAVMSDISYILTSIYDGLGSFNIPIAFSMTLTIAMLCIGWYRFKGGV